MKPIIGKVSFDDMTSRQVGKICSCSPRCTTGITLTTYKDGMIICHNDARKHLYELINVLDEDSRTSWTETDETYIIALVKAKGIYHGINRDIAEALGKTYPQTKSKIRRMKAQGKI